MPPDVATKLRQAGDSEGLRTPKNWPPVPSKQRTSVLGAPARYGGMVSISFILFNEGVLEGITRSDGSSAYPRVFIGEGTEHPHAQGPDWRSRRSEYGPLATGQSSGIYTWLRETQNHQEGKDVCLLGLS